MGAAAGLGACQRAKPLPSPSLPAGASPPKLPPWPSLPPYLSGRKIWGLGRDGRADLEELQGFRSWTISNRPARGLLEGEDHVPALPRQPGVVTEIPEGKNRQRADWTTAAPPQDDPLPFRES